MKYVTSWFLSGFWEEFRATIYRNWKPEHCVLLL